MESRTLGATGIEVSALALGTWELGGLWWGPVDANDGVAILRRALSTWALLLTTPQTNTETAGRK